MPIYWSLLHELALIKYAGNTCQINQLYFVHLFPTIAMGLLWFTTDIRLDSSHGLKLSPIALIYCFINFVATKVRGKPLYWFLDWEDYKSPLISLAITATFVIAFQGIASLSHLAKPKAKTE